MSKFIKHEKGFFDQLIIKKLRSLPNGGDCVIIYQKILELALDSEGTLTFSGFTNTFEEELSLILSENVENVKNVINVLRKTNLLVSTDNSSFIISDFPKMTCNKNSLRRECMREYMREYRANKKIREQENKKNECKKINWFSNFTKKNNIAKEKNNEQ